MKVVVRAPSNIAFIKYWGKKNEKLRIPANSSISMNLSDAYTETSVEFKKILSDDLVIIDGKKIDGKEKERIGRHLNLIRKMARINFFAEVLSKNNFPKGAGIASSASGFAALTLAGVKAAGLNLSEKELSVLARLGSGSACRSIPDGFVEWKKGSKSSDSYAYSLKSPEYWDIRDIIVVVGEKSKKVGSTEGHKEATSSPFYKARISEMDKKIADIKLALKNKDFTKFGRIVEEEAINMHTVMMTSKPPLFYWLPKTLEIMQSITTWREAGLETYFTIDAGPNIHVICRSKDVRKVKTKLEKIQGVKKIIINRVSKGARIVK
ncbi:MAG: Diphosphomevalonate decarboxylase [Candidatus Woesebacteria bacterium GW2011_GWD1_41_12]|uniref:diphosphomevalonate decarboxylase n=2 Tax=Candidatus Woeseibacteriota TaxID=1752722 RepID=A0A0G0WTV7_9BACT|nr:MAG: Diphosphomevalonate decarboxylase [Candidatus Woesebacteria bacterium GW2011_GWD1_41_12]KKS16165.1 MAG: Diphosphomevalonate decarboxylase [Candidatus Woesebacteria bacterium GW2011_GWA1_41_7]